MLINFYIGHVYQQSVVIVVINSHLLAVDQHYNHRPLINAVGVGVAQHPFFFRQNTCSTLTRSPFLLYVKVVEVSFP